MSASSMIVGLDIGTTKISVIIAELTGNGDANIVGVGYCPSTGMRRGVVVNIDKTTEAIEKAIEEAERMAGVEVASVYTGIAGDHIRSINSKG
ncbi:cell division protein FtsA, partial [bacterium SM23_57]